MLVAMGAFAQMQEWSNGATNLAGKIYGSFYRSDPYPYHYICFIDDTKGILSFQGSGTPTNTNIQIPFTYTISSEIITIITSDGTITGTIIGEKGIVCDRFYQLQGRTITKYPLIFLAL